jgi:glycosyltransferase involved in cell wall biosynthesis
LKTGKEIADVVFLGRYSESEILSGPEKTSKRIFFEHTKLNHSYFIQYFFDGRKYGIIKKLFGKGKADVINNSEILTLGLFPALLKLLKLKPKIIHVITFERFAVLAFFCKILFKTRIIYNTHGIVTYENTELKKTPFLLRQKDRFCEKLFLKYSDIIIFYSENSIDIAEKYFKLNEARAVILSNGIDDVFSSSREKPKSKSENLRLVIHYQNELHSGSIDFLNKCLEKITLPIEIFIVGNEKASIINPSTCFKVNYVEKMTPKKLSEFYSDKDIFLSLNNYDTFSISTAEAMSAGLVPIVTEETGMSRYIWHGENGFTVKYGDFGKLAELINNLQSGKIALSELSLNASKIFEILTWSQIYESYKNFYTKR